MRNRTVQLNIRLTEAENKRLKQHSRKAGLTASAYIRMLINGYQPKETPPGIYYETVKLLTQVYGGLQGNENEKSRKQLQNLLLKLHKAVAQPEQIEIP